jgi:apolipoprotein N-acyltransferase
MEKRHDGDNRAPELQAVILTFLALSWFTVLARCWVRIKMINAFAMDDWLTVFTLQLFTIYGSFVLYGAHWGCGHHMHDLTAKQRVNSMRVSCFHICLLTSADDTI